jgi:hypothetical protein
MKRIKATTGAWTVTLFEAGRTTERKAGGAHAAWPAKRPPPSRIAERIAGFRQQSLRGGPLHQPTILDGLVLDEVNQWLPLVSGLAHPVVDRIAHPTKNKVPTPRIGHLARPDWPNTCFKRPI